MELNIDDLMKVCPHCNGQGVITNPPTPQRQGGYGPRPVQGWQHTTDCTACCKSGYELTTTGEAIAQLLEVLRTQKRI